MTPAILIVEDDPEMADVLRQGFEREYRVALAHDGEEGLDTARKHSFHAIVLDTMLPRIDGFEVARELRRTGNQTPIPMLTARDSIADTVRGFDCGVEDYVTKPFSFLNLAARVKALVRRGQPRRSILEARGLRVDTAAHTVEREGAVIHLTRTEFQVLELLMREAGKVVRREEILRAIWGQTAVVAGNNLDVAISGLRARIDKGYEHKLIRTVRGFGYKIA
ncbi:MAG: response regulator transcription factor [Acidobacteriota bacterium]|nr:response regulator transcription factor [Acidobacteriota bacterium]